MTTDKDKAPELDIEAAIVDPSPYGFAWGYGELNKNDMLVAKNAPYIVHLDQTLMTLYFGGQYFLDSANKRSARVRDQTIRDEIWKDKSLASDMVGMKRWILETALGRKSRKSRTTVIEKIVPVYFADDDTEFTSKEACHAYNKALREAAQIEE